MSQRIEQASRDTAPAGSIRFNTDSSKLEIYNGEAWFEIDATSPELQTGGTRGLWAGRNSPHTDAIDFVNIDSTGNASDFGNLSQARRSGAGTANSIHSIFAGGYLPGVANTIDRVLIQTTGNAADFGDLFLKTHEMSGSSDSHGGLS